MNKKRVVVVGLTLGIGFLVACGFVVGQSSVRVVQDSTPPGPKAPPSVEALPSLPQTPTVLSPASPDQKPPYTVPDGQTNAAPSSLPATTKPIDSTSRRE